MIIEAEKKKLVSAYDVTDFSPDSYGQKILLRFDGDYFAFTEIRSVDEFFEKYSGSDLDVYESGLGSWVSWAQDCIDAAMCGVISPIYERNSKNKFAHIVTNNDGRSQCYWCGAETKKVMGFTSNYDVCPNCNI